MQFEKSFVNNYTYNENSESMVGGLPIRALFDENKQLDAKFDNMSIPIGLVVEKNSDIMKGGYISHYKMAHHSIDELIDDNLFDNLISKVSYREHKNSTKKNQVRGPRNKTKKSI